MNSRPPIGRGLCAPCRWNEVYLSRPLPSHFWLADIFAPLIVGVPRPLVYVRSCRWGYQLVCDSTMIY